MRNIFLFLSIFITNNVIAQPYYDTGIANKYVEQNSFLNSQIQSEALPIFSKVKDKLPQVFWEGNEEAVEAYWKAWEIAFSNLRSPNENNGFVSNYIDPAFNGNIFMWDSSFMVLFGIYGENAFHFQGSLDNFYSKQHKDGFICREIRGADGSDVFQKFDISSTGPNIMPWAELEYFNQYGDIDRFNSVFPVLLAYYQWYKTNRTWQDGTYISSGWGCGMDNQPRMHAEFNQEWSHGFMSWIDISFQEVLSAKVLSQMAEVLGYDDLSNELKNDALKLAQIIDDKMWDDNEGYYFDKFRDGKLSNIKSIASYWGLLGGEISDQKLDRFVTHLSDEAKFNRLHRVPTLSADNEHYVPEGGYWNGSIWAPTAYMVLKGLTANAYDSLAFEIAYNHHSNVVEVFKKTGTFFENYSPDFVKGNDKKDFVGWTGLAPINVLLEYIFGIRSHAQDNLLIIDVNLLDEYKVENYPFGKGKQIDIKVSKRKHKSEKPVVTISSNKEFKLKLKVGHEVHEYDVKQGQNIF
jgi:glycogen debranching enzyme